MKIKNLSKHTGKIAIASALIAASVYLLMVNVTLAHIETISGQVPFDMRPLGYSATEAAMLLDALGAEGRAYYLNRQIALDTLYPAMLMLTLISTISWFGQGMPNRTLIRFGIALSLGCALLDYIENSGVAAMILSWPNFSQPLVYATSTATILKSVSTTAAVILTILVALNRARFSHRKRASIGT